MRTTDQMKIGPNAIIQTVYALRAHYGDDEANDLLRRGDHAHLIDNLPAEMVDEAEFHALVHMVQAEIGEAQTASILQDAGQRTADYLLAHRIPRFFQRLVRLLPRRLGLALLLKAISRHAWTFVGSGQFRFHIARQPTIHVLVTYPSVTPVAHFYGGTFAHLLHTLIDPHATLQTATSQEASAIDCTYTLLFSSSQAV
jgi:divinyl protochlorophyllide a 8-vinyl-reductase